MSDLDYKKCTIRGILNIENNCYLNSILQILFNCSHFNHKLKIQTNITRLSYEYLELLYQRKKDTEKYLNPEKVLTIMNKILKHEPGQQRDICDYFYSFFENIISIKTIDLKSEFFGLSIEYVYICELCCQKTFKTEQTTEISLYVLSKSILNELIMSQFMNQVSKKCDNCNNICNHQVFSRIKKFPIYLMIILNKTDGISKKNYNVISPEILKIENKNYHLKSIINHLGNTENGHYYNYCKYENDWYEINDTCVKKINHFNHPYNYILFYELEL